MSNTNRSIVMVEWARNNQPTHKTRDQFLWHQMFLSLLYGEVLAQDETIVCSTNMPKWFRDAESFGLLEELFQCGGLAVLKRPAERYPNDELKDLARKNPITARRLHLETFSVNNNGEALHFKDYQLQFHNRLEVLLGDKRHRYMHKFAGKKNLSPNLMGRFSSELQTVLTDKRYEPWLRSAFPHITPDVAYDVVRHVENPERALERIRNHRPDQKPRITRLSGDLQFSTALAVQLAATYPKKAAHALQSLTETVFARPFCQDEGADGRYGRLLRSLPTELELPEAQGSINVVHVQTVDLDLPAPAPGFGKVINAVREMPSGQRLKAAMVSLGIVEPTFVEAIRAWKDVAADIATLMHSSKMTKVGITAALIDWGKHSTIEIILGGLVAAALHPSKIIPALIESTAVALGSPATSILSKQLLRRVKSDIRAPALAAFLAQGVRFDVQRHPVVSTVSTGAR